MFSCNVLMTIKPTHIYNTRNQSLKKSKIKNQRTIAIAGPKLWDSLPPCHVMLHCLTVTHA